MLQKKRVEGLLKHMDDIGLEQVLIRNPILIWYYTEGNYRVNDRASILYISKNNGIKMINNSVVPEQPLGIEFCNHPDGADVCREIAKYTDHTKPLGFDGEYPAKWVLPLKELHAATDLVLADKALNLQLSYKDENEQQLMREASRLNDKVMAKVRTIIKEGMTEMELAMKIRELFLEEKGEAPWMLVAFGENSAEVHHWPSSTRKLQPGDNILIDMGSPWNKYHSDMTRTFFWKSVSDRQRFVYETVLKANKEAEKAVKVGVTCESIDKVARDIITEAGFGEFFTHRLGHYIGLNLHDPGDINVGNTDTTHPGMCFSCEPGIYLPGEFGVRIEDLVICQDYGAEILNHDNKELEILG
jgi:Xaa-Pro dipeptidase